MRVLSSKVLLGISIVGCALVVLASVGESLSPVTARADSYRLYASSCLGGWENPERATGAPDVEGDAALVNEGNAAYLRDNTHAQIFCGDFRGDVLENTVPKDIIVAFSWAVNYPTQNEATVPLNGRSATSSPRTEEYGDEMPEETEEETTPPADTPTEEEEENGGDSVSDPTDEEPSEEERKEIPAPDASRDESKEETEPEVPGESSEEPLSFFGSVAYAQEISENEDREAGEEGIESASSTDGVPPADAPYGLVEVLYTLNGEEWKSLGFVERDEFATKRFEIPITEAEAWEDISQIQISVQSVPGINGISPAIFLDALWLETEYTEIVPAVEVPVLEEEEIVVAFDPGDVPSISIISWSDVAVDPQATHRCLLTPAVIDLSAVSTASVEIILEKTEMGRYHIEIGAAPVGIELLLEGSNDRFYQPEQNERILALAISRSEDSQQGTFTIPIVYTKEGHPESSVICQLNIMNE